MNRRTLMLLRPLSSSMIKSHRIRGSLSESKAEQQASVQLSSKTLNQKHTQHKSPHRKLAPSRMGDAGPDTGTSYPQCQEITGGLRDICRGIASLKGGAAQVTAVPHLSKSGISSGLAVVNCLTPYTLKNNRHGFASIQKKARPTSAPAR